jgi:hypothetical protein
VWDRARGVTKKLNNRRDVVNVIIIIIIIIINKFY